MRVHPVPRFWGPGMSVRFRERSPDAPPLTRRAGSRVPHPSAVLPRMGGRARTSTVRRVAGGTLFDPPKRMGCPIHSTVSSWNGWETTNSMARKRRPPHRRCLGNRDLRLPICCTHPSTWFAGSPWARPRPQCRPASHRCARPAGRRWPPPHWPSCPRPASPGCRRIQTSRPHSA